MVTLLFKETLAANSYFSKYQPEARVVAFWIHQQTRLTDGHVVLQPNGKAQIVVNWSAHGKPFTIAERARLDGRMRREDAGMTEWRDADVIALLEHLGVDVLADAAIDTFVDVIIGPICANERESAERLSIRWDVDDKDIKDAIGLRYQVVQKAEAVLNDAGLLVDPNGAVVSDETVSATLEVAEFTAAKALLWKALSAGERRYNCRIDQE
ncbi:MAG: hypothetical protein AAF718_12290 [Pseudomonadota bacterium]